MDFNNEATMGKKPTELVSSIIIEKVYNYLEADEDWAKKMIQGGAQPYSIARSRLRNLFFCTHPLLKRSLEEKEFDWITSKCLSTDHQEVNPEDALECFGLIFKVLDSVGLWKIDTVKKFERHRVEEANKQHGY